MIWFATKTLGWTLDEFWRSTPRFFFALLNAHLEMTGVTKSEKKIPVYRFIDDIPAGMR